MTQVEEVRKVTPEDEGKNTSFDIIEGKAKVEIETYFDDSGRGLKRVRVILKNRTGYQGSIFFCANGDNESVSVTVSEGIVTAARDFTIWSNAPQLVAKKDKISRRIIVKEAKKRGK